MSEITLESLAARVAELERRLAEQDRSTGTAPKDWRRVAGMFTDSPLMREIDAAGAEIRRADRPSEDGAES